MVAHGAGRADGKPLENALVVKLVAAGRRVGADTRLQADGTLADTIRIDHASLLDAGAV